MTQENQALDLNGLASGADGRVAAMLAELEGNSLSASEAATGRSMWTRQFAASGKPGKKVDA
jgi:hypothetical protein